MCANPTYHGATILLWDASGQMPAATDSFYSLTGQLENNHLFSTLLNHNAEVVRELGLELEKSYDKVHGCTVYIQRLRMWISRGLSQTDIHIYDHGTKVKKTLS